MTDFERRRLRSEQEARKKHRAAEERDRQEAYTRGAPGSEGANSPERIKAQRQARQNAPAPGRARTDPAIHQKSAPISTQAKEAHQRRPALQAAAREQAARAAAKAARETARASGRAMKGSYRAGTAAGAALADAVDRRREARKRAEQENRNRAHQKRTSANPGRSGPSGGRHGHEKNNNRENAREKADSNQQRQRQTRENSRRKSQQGRSRYDRQPYEIEVKDNMVHVRAMWNEDFNAGARKLGGTFTAADKTWRFPLAQKPAVEQLCKAVYLGQGQSRPVSNVARTALGPKLGTAVKVGMAAGRGVAMGVGYGYDGMSGAYKAGRLGRPLAPGSLKRAFLRGKDDDDDFGLERGLDMESD